MNQTTAMARAKWREIDGVLLLDKPVGLSSNDALQTARRIFSARKAGHGGTLDPLASGLLPIAFGEATKFINEVVESAKTYLAEIRLGQESTTGDAEGDLAPSDHDNRIPTLTEGEVETALATLRGDIEQLPPMYSALKHQGKPLYAYARAGREVTRKPRRVTISELVLERPFTPGMATLSVRVTCTKGTYIRVLAEDIGRALGCGAYLHGLRRTAVGIFHVDAASSLDQLKTVSVDETALMRRLMPVDAMVTAMPACTISGDHITRFCHGQPVLLANVNSAAPALPADGPDDRIRVYGNEQFLGLARIIDNQIAPKRLVVIPSPIDAPTRRITE